LLPGDRLVLCTDGLHGLVREDDIIRIAGTGSLEDAVNALIGSANEAGGGDNITVVILEWSEEEAG
jgi:protein phosphatase